LDDLNTENPGSASGLPVPQKPGLACSKRVPVLRRRIAIEGHQTTGFGPSSTLKGDYNYITVYELYIYIMCDI